MCEDKPTSLQSDAIMNWVIVGSKAGIEAVCRYLCMNGMFLNGVLKPAVSNELLGAGCVVAVRVLQKSFQSSGNQAASRARSHSSLLQLL